MVEVRHSSAWGLWALGVGWGGVGRVRQGASVGAKGYVYV